MQSHGTGGRTPSSCALLLNSVTLQHDLEPGGPPPLFSPRADNHKMAEPAMLQGGVCGPGQLWGSGLRYVPPTCRSGGSALLAVVGRLRFFRGGAEDEDAA